MITSSVLAIGSMASADDHDGVYDETEWTDCFNADFSALTRSKTMAERAAWEFAETETESGNYCPEIATICPSWIFGEILASGDATSNSLIRDMMTGAQPKLLTLSINMVDIKDVANAHYRALTNPEAANQRFILSREKHIWMRDISEQLVAGLAKEKRHGYPIPTVQTGYCSVRFAAMFSQEAADVLPLLNKT